MIVVLYLLKFVIFALGLVCIGLYFQRKDRLEQQKKLRDRLRDRLTDMRMPNTPLHRK